MMIHVVRDCIVSAHGTSCVEGKYPVDTLCHLALKTKIPVIAGYVVARVLETVARDVFSHALTFPSNDDLDAIAESWE